MNPRHIILKTFSSCSSIKTVKFFSVSKKVCKKFPKAICLTLSKLSKDLEPASLEACFCNSDLCAWDLHRFWVDAEDCFCCQFESPESSAYCNWGKTYGIVPVLLREQFTFLVSSEIKTILFLCNTQPSLVNHYIVSPQPFPLSHP